VSDTKGRYSMRAGREGPAAYSRVVGLWAPSRFVTGSGIDVNAFVSDINEKIQSRGFILFDGQILTRPLDTTQSIEEIFEPEVPRAEFKGHEWRVWKFAPDDGMRSERDTAKPDFPTLRWEVVEERLPQWPPFGGGVATMPAQAKHQEEMQESLKRDLPIPERRPWTAEQRAYFGLDQPYQMGDEGDRFTWSHIMTQVVGPYLESDELIAGLVHGGLDNYPFYCPCHSATVVYTTRQRLICMSCGATHAVLRQPPNFVPPQLLTPREWDEFFDDKGSRHYEEVALATVDFQDIEHVEMIWTTDQWEQASDEFVFFARSSPEEIQSAIRGTEADPLIFLEAGWEIVDQPPPPALQLMESSIDVGLDRNAQHAFAEGVSEFLTSYVHPERLVHAIPQLFRAIELLLKMRLEALDPHGLADEPNNPTVLARLAGQSVVISGDEVETVAQLRRLRNRLQHGHASFNHRTGLALCRQAVVFVDRFVDEEFDMWTGDAISGSDWQRLLELPEVASRAARIAEARLERFRSHPEAEITVCPWCGHAAMLRSHPSTGASCVYCGHVPVIHDAD